MLYFDSGTDGTILPTYHTSNGLDGVLRTFFIEDIIISIMSSVNLHFRVSYPSQQNKSFSSLNAICFTTSLIKTLKPLI